MKLLIISLFLLMSTTAFAQQTHATMFGDTWETVAAEYGVTVETLTEANGLTVNDELPDQVIIPASSSGTTAFYSDRFITKAGYQYFADDNIEGRSFNVSLHVNIIDLKNIFDSTVVVPYIFGHFYSDLAQDQFGTYEESGSNLVGGIGVVLEQADAYSQFGIGWQSLDVQQAIASGFTNNPYYGGLLGAVEYCNFAGRQANDTWFTDFKVGLDVFWEFDHNTTVANWSYSPASNNLHNKYIRGMIQLSLMDWYLSKNNMMSFNPLVKVTSYNFDDKVKGYYEAGLAIDAFYKGSNWLNFFFTYQGGGHKVGNINRWTLGAWLNVGSIHKVVSKRL